MLSAFKYAMHCSYLHQSMLLYHTHGGKPFAELPDEWANQNARKNVYADGKEFSVQYNFEAALQRFQPDYLCPAFFFGLMQSVSIKTTSASEMIKSV
jgi:hypothetical protein